MEEEKARASRRNFIIGGATTAAIAGPLAIAASVSKTSTGATWNPLAVVRPSEVAEWQALVGGKFHIVGEAGKYVAKLSAVVHGSSDPKRPSNLARPLSFLAYFEMNAAVAPRGQKTYKVVHPTKGVMDMFLGRGADKAGKTVVYAVFN